MSRLVLLFTIIFSSVVLASKTTHVWILNPKDQLQGDCYQVDNETLGEKFKVRVAKEDCKPRKTDFIFYPSRGKCYEVDSETEGKKYIKKEQPENCRPKDTTTGYFEIYGEAGCYTVDTKTKGQKFYKKERPRECEDAKVSMTYWEYISPGRGKCYEGINNNGKEVKILTDEEKCRTKKTQLYFVRKKETSGECIEEDAENPKAYSNEVKIENCKPSDTVFIFYTPPRKKRGNCFEVDTETKGDRYINIVAPSNCAPN